MPATQVPVREDTRPFGELLTIHAVMARGAELVAGSFTRLADGAAVDTKTLVTTVRWLVAFVRHHLDTGGEVVRPVLGARFPDLIPRLDRLVEDNDALTRGLDELESVIERIAEERRMGGTVGWGHAMREGTLASHRIRDELARHFAAEELQLRWLFPKVSDEDVPRLRQAITGDLLRGGPHLVFGFLEHPEPLSAREGTYTCFPRPVRLARGFLLSRFRRTLKDLAAD